MSEFDNLKHDAEKEVKEHPEQVREGEQEVEKKLGLPGQGGDQPGQGGQDQGQQDQASGNQGDQDSAGRGQ